MRTTSKGQVSIPIEIREKLGLLPDTEVVFEREGNAVRIRRATGKKGGRGERIVSRLRGTATVSMSTEEQVLWQGSPSQWTNFWPFVLCLLVIPIPYAIWRYVATRCFTYEVTTQRIRIRQGVFSRRTDSLELYRTARASRRHGSGDVRPGRDGPRDRADQPGEALAAHARPAEHRRAE